MSDDLPRRTKSKGKRKRQGLRISWHLPVLLGVLVIVGVVLTQGDVGKWFGGQPPAPHPSPPSPQPVNAPTPPVVAHAAPAASVPPPAAADSGLPAMQQVRGNWTTEMGTLISPAEGVPLIQFVDKPPEEFTLALKLRRLSGDNTFAMGVPIGDRQVLVALDAHAGNVSGLEALDGRNVSDNEATHRGRLLEPEKDVAVECTVRKTGIACRCNGTKVIDWHGDSQRLSLPGDFAVPDKKALFFATIASRFAIRDITITAAASEPAASEPTPAPTVAAKEDTPAPPKLAPPPGEIPKVDAATIMQAPVIRDKLSDKSFTEGTVSALAVSPDGKPIVTGVGARGAAVRLFRTKKWTPLRIDKRTATIELYFSPGGTYLAAQNAYQAVEGEKYKMRFWNLVTIWKTKDFKPQELFDADTNMVTTIGWLDDEHIAVGMFQFGVSIYNVKTRKVVCHTPGGPLSTATAIAASPDGKLLATGMDYGGIRFFQIPEFGENADGTMKTLIPIGEVRQNSRKITPLQFSADSRRLASVSIEEKSVLVWDVPSQSVVMRFEGQGAAFSPDGTRLVTSGVTEFDRQMVLWDTATGQPLARLLPTDDAKDFVTRVGFLSDGKRVVGATSSGMLRFWDVEK